jgi:hypothetical protein
MVISIYFSFSYFIIATISHHFVVATTFFYHPIATQPPFRTPTSIHLTMPQISHRIDPQTCFPNTSTNLILFLKHKICIPTHTPKSISFIFVTKYIMNVHYVHLWSWIHSNIIYTNIFVHINHFILSSHIIHFIFIPYYLAIAWNWISNLNILVAFHLRFSQSCLYAHIPPLYTKKGKELHDSFEVAFNHMPYLFANGPLDMVFEHLCDCFHLEDLVNDFL